MKLSSLAVPFGAVLSCLFAAGDPVYASNGDSDPFPPSKGNLQVIIDSNSNTNNKSAVGGRNVRDAVAGTSPAPDSLSLLLTADVVGSDLSHNSIEDNIALAERVPAVVSDLVEQLSAIQTGDLPMADSALKALKTHAEKFLATYPTSIEFMKKAQAEAKNMHQEKELAAGSTRSSLRRSLVEKKDHSKDTDMKPSSVEHESKAQSGGRAGAANKYQKQEFASNMPNSKPRSAKRRRGQRRLHDPFFPSHTSPHHQHHKHLQRVQDSAVSGNHELLLGSILKNVHSTARGSGRRLQKRKIGKKVSKGGQLQEDDELMGNQCMLLTNCVKGMSQYDMMVYYYSDDLDPATGELDDSIIFDDEDTRNLQVTYNSSVELAKSLFRANQNDPTKYGKDAEKCNELLMKFHRNIEVDGIPNWEGATVSQVCVAEGTQAYISMDQVATKISLEAADDVAKEMYTCAAGLYNSAVTSRDYHVQEEFVFGKAAASLEVDFARDSVKVLPSKYNGVAAPDPKVLIDGRTDGLFVLLDRKGNKPVSIVLQVNPYGNQGIGKEGINFREVSFYWLNNPDEITISVSLDRVKWDQIYDSKEKNQKHRGGEATTKRAGSLQIDDGDVHNIFCETVKFNPSKVTGRYIMISMKGFHKKEFKSSHFYNKYANKWPHCTSTGCGCVCPNKNIDALKRECAGNPKCSGFSFSNTGANEGCLKDCSKGEEWYHHPNPYGTGKGFGYWEKADSRAFVGLTEIKARGNEPQKIQGKSTEYEVNFEKDFVVPTGLNMDSTARDEHGHAKSSKNSDTGAVQLYEYDSVPVNDKLQAYRNLAADLYDWLYDNKLSQSPYRHVYKAKLTDSYKKAREFFIIAGEAKDDRVVRSYIADAVEAMKSRIEETFGGSFSSYLGGGEGVDCGGKRKAQSCSKCVFKDVKNTQQSCGGDCIWKQSQCLLKNTDEEKQKQKDDEDKAAQAVEDLKKLFIEGYKQIQYGFSLVFGEKASVGFLCGIKEVVQQKGLEKFPGMCCLDAPYQGESDNWGREHVCGTGCKQPGPFLAGLNEGACKAQGGIWCGTKPDCTVLKVCVDEQIRLANETGKLAYAKFLSPAIIENPLEADECGRSRVYFGYDKLYSNDNDICNNVMQLNNTNNFGFLEKMVGQGSGGGGEKEGRSGSGTVQQLKAPDTTESSSEAIQNADKWKNANFALEQTLPPIEAVGQVLAGLKCPGDFTGALQTICAVATNIANAVSVALEKVVKKAVEIANFVYNKFIAPVAKQYKQTWENTGVLFDNMSTMYAHMQNMEQTFNKEVEKMGNKLNQDMEKKIDQVLKQLAKTRALTELPHQKAVDYNDMMYRTIMAMNERMQAMDERMQAMDERMQAMAMENEVHFKT